MKAFLFFVDDWLASTKIAAMNAEEERAYLRLLLHAAKQDDCGLPDDDRLLAELSRLGPKWKRESGHRVRACFELRDGRLYNARLLQEWTRQQEFRSKQSQRAKGRWKHAAEDAAACTTDDAGDMPRQMPRDKPRDVPRQSHARAGSEAAISQSRYPVGRGGGPPAQPPTRQDSQPSVGSLPQKKPEDSGTAPALGAMPPARPPAKRTPTQRRHNGHSAEQIANIRTAAREQLRRELGRDPTRSEVAELVRRVSAPVQHRRRV